MQTIPALPTAGHTIAEVLNRWPAATAVFLKRRMACPGCTMAPFETLDEAAVCYGLRVDELLSALHAAVNAACQTAASETRGR